MQQRLTPAKKSLNDLRNFSEHNRYQDDTYLVNAGKPAKKSTQKNIIHNQTANLWQAEVREERPLPREGKYMAGWLQELFFCTFRPSIGGYVLTSIFRNS